jgi:Bacterial Ig-like domain (group 2)
MRKNYLIIILILFFSCKKNDISPTTNPTTAETIKVTSVSISPLSSLFFQLNVGKQLTSILSPTNASNNKIVWTSSNSSIANVSTTGFVTFTAYGKVTITASSQENATILSRIDLYALQQYDVHVVGKGSIGGFGNTAIYWKNSQASSIGLTPITFATNGFSASSVVVENNEVLIAGISNILNSSTGTTMPRVTLWRNNVPTYLSGLIPGDTTYATGRIKIIGNNIYITGGRNYYVGCPGSGGTGCQYSSNAYYWTVNGSNIIKNEIVKANYSNVGCNDIAAIGSDLYFSGGYFDNSYRTACYWKNNSLNLTNLTSNTTFASANSMIAINNDLYFGGSDGCPNSGCIFTAKIWKNNMSNVISLSDGTRNASVSKLANIGNEIYACGYEVNTTGKTIPKLWKIVNNNVTSIDLTNQIEGVANSIFIKNNDIFVCGYTGGANSLQVAKCWRVIDDIVLNEPITIPEPAFFSYATDITVN